MYSKRLLLVNLILFVAATFELKAQQTYKDDFTYTNTNAPERKAAPYPELYQVDVAWQKRIERIIDSREKQNNCLNWPRNHMGKIVHQAVLNGVLTPFKDDTLKTFYTPEEVKELGGVESTISIPDPNFPDDPYAMIDSTINEPFDPEKIVKWRVIEDWIFDRKHSRMIVRIIAIAPLFRPVIGGTELPEQPLYWIRWDDEKSLTNTDLRKFLVNIEMFNRSNDANRLSMMQFFEQRMFSSYIIKQSNEFDMHIKYYEEFKDDPFAALLESERIKQNLFEMEHDLWEY